MKPNCELVRVSFIYFLFVSPSGDFDTFLESFFLSSLHLGWGWESHVKRGNVNFAKGSVAY